MISLSSETAPSVPSADDAVKPSLGARGSRRKVAGAKRGVRNGSKFLSQHTEQTASTRLPGESALGEEASDEDDMQDDFWVSELGEDDECDDMLENAGAAARKGKSSASSERDVVPQRLGTYTDTHKDHMEWLKEAISDEGLWDDLGFEEEGSEDADEDLVNCFLEDLKVEAVPTNPFRRRCVGAPDLDDLMLDVFTKEPRQPTAVVALRRIAACPGPTSPDSVGASSPPRRLVGWALQAEIEQREPPRPHSEETPATKCPSTDGSWLNYTGEDAEQEQGSAQRQQHLGQAPQTPQQQSMPQQPQQADEDQAPPLPQLPKGYSRPRQHYSAPASGSRDSVLPARPVQAPTTAPATVGRQSPLGGAPEASPGVVPDLPTGSTEASCSSPSLAQSPHAGPISSALRRINRSMT